jgi:hypothetical protein
LTGTDAAFDNGCGIADFVRLLSNAFAGIVIRPQ